MKTLNLKGQAALLTKEQMKKVMGGNIAEIKCRTNDSGEPFTCEYSTVAECVENYCTDPNNTTCGCG